MAAKLLRGYKRVPGSARRYLTPAGKEISRYEYDSRVLRASGSPFKNRAQAEKFRQSQDWKIWRGRILEGTGKKLTYRSPEFTAAAQLTAARKDLPIHTRRDGTTYTNDHDDAELTAADGPLAQLLVALGYREEDWDWAVGDTPKGVSTK